MKELSKALGIEHYETDYSIELGEKLPMGGYINEHVYRERSETMKKINPMHDPKIVEKMRQTKKEKFASGELIPRKLSENEKQMLSKRMKRNNPTKSNPACTNTAKPVDVIYEDGTVESYAYAKELSNVKGIPYDTVKWMLRNNKGSKKHNIKHIIQKEKICQG